MFYHAATFNQAVGQWNFSQVTTMGYMFQWATAFNKDIGQWSISGDCNVSEMFKDSGVTRYTFDELEKLKKK